MDEPWKNIINAPILPTHIVQHFEGLEGTLKEGESLSEITIFINEVTDKDRKNQEFLKMQPANVVTVLTNEGPGHYDEILVSRYQAFQKENIEKHHFDLFFQTGWRSQTSPTEDPQWSTPFQLPFEKFGYFRPVPYDIRTDDAAPVESFQKRIAHLMKDFKRILVTYDKHVKT